MHNGPHPWDETASRMALERITEGHGAGKPPLRWRQIETGNRAAWLDFLPAAARSPSAFCSGSACASVACGTVWFSDTFSCKLLHGAALRGPQEPLVPAPACQHHPVWPVALSQVGLCWFSLRDLAVTLISPLLWPLPYS